MAGSYGLGKSPLAEPIRQRHFLWSWLTDGVSRRASVVARTHCKVRSVVAGSHFKVLPFEPADAKRSTKCVAGSHFKVLLILFLPICCIIVALPDEQGSNEP